MTRPLLHCNVRVVEEPIELKPRSLTSLFCNNQYWLNYNCDDVCKYLIARLLRRAENVNVYAGRGKRWYTICKQTIAKSFWEHSAQTRREPHSLTQPRTDMNTWTVSMCSTLLLLSVCVCDNFLASKQSNLTKPQHTFVLQEYSRNVVGLLVNCKPMRWL